MGIKASLVKPFAKYMANRIYVWSSNPDKYQSQIFSTLLKKGAQTQFGKDFGIDQIKNYDEFTAAVPLTDYEGHRAYIERIKNGERDVLWPGVPLYFAKTSGTTSGIKYIPITSDSVPYHVGSARNAVFCYIAQTGKSQFFDHRMIFLSGSPELETVGGVLTGRLSGIVNHHIPSYVKRNQLPSYATNCIEDWEQKLAAIIRETRTEDLGLVGGIPSWVQMYFEQLLAQTGAQHVHQLFPNLQLYVYGGVNFAPYRSVFNELLGGAVDTIETYPASEGFIAFQDSQEHEGLLLQVNAGIFYEFVKAEEAHLPHAKRYRLHEVSLGVNYAIVLNTNAGLWGYLIGDTVKFVSLAPYRIVVTGRTKHFISAFGEHVISEEVEQALALAIAKFGGAVIEFHVAPQVQPASGLPYHEWFIAFKQPPVNVDAFAAYLDEVMCAKNVYYQDLIAGKILRPLQITPVAEDAFIQYMKKAGKLGGQNKLPRLADNRIIADQLTPLPL